MASYTTGQAPINMQQVSAVPSAYQGDALELARAQRLAQMLSSSEPAQGQMISGRYVAPSWTQNLAQLANAATGAYFANKAETQQQALAEKLRKGETEAFADFEKIKRGTPAVEGGVYGPDNKLTMQTTPDMIGPQGELTSQYRQVAPVAGVAPNAPAAYANLYADPRASQRLRDFAFNKMNEGPIKVGPEDVLLEAGTYKPLYQGAGKQPDSIRYAIAIGRLPADPKTWTAEEAAYAKQLVESKTSAGASKYDFGNMINKSLSDVAPMLVASKTATSGAIQQADAANRIIQSLDTNKLFTGAGANQKLQAAQIGQMLGVTGNRTEEIVANTRQAIQGLAQLTLQGRKQMRGEGAITESEGALAQRAMSGDISLTAGELRILANAAKRSAKFTYDQHQSMMGALAKDSPNSVPYYQLEVNPSIFGESTSDVRAKADAILNKPKP
jgi:hypothetical protein